MARRPTGSRRLADLVRRAQRRLRRASDELQPAPEQRAPPASQGDLPAEQRLLARLAEDLRLANLVTRRFAVLLASAALTSSGLNTVGLPTPAPGGPLLHAVEAEVCRISGSLLCQAKQPAAADESAGRARTIPK